MRSNRKRKSEWLDDEYARRKRAAKAWGVNAGYLFSAQPQTVSAASRAVKTALKRDTKIAQ